MRTREQIFDHYLENNNLIDKLDAKDFTPYREIQHLRYLNRVAYENESEKISCNE